MNGHNPTYTSQTVADICINRPEKHNALNPQMIEGLIQALEQAHAIPEVRLIAIRASGTHFVWVLIYNGYKQACLIVKQKIRR